MNIENLREKNPEIKLYTTNDVQFKKYGRVIENIGFKDIIKVADNIKMPDEGSKYETSTPEFECLNELKKQVTDIIYGEMPIQMGFCYGFSSYLNGLEWHIGSEVNVAVTDMVLLFGELKHVENERYDSSLVEGFLIKKGQAIEVYSTTLHFCPAQVSDNGFKSVVILPLGTNLPLENSEEGLLYRKNKWLISHVENKELISKGVVSGIYGENYKVKY